MYLPRSLASLRRNIRRESQDVVEAMCSSVFSMRYSVYSVYSTVYDAWLGGEARFARGSVKNYLTRVHGLCWPSTYPVSVDHVF